MANLGEITEIVNASELTLEVGSDTYIMLTNLVLHGGRTENRVATTDAGALYTYGKGDHWFSATLVMTPNEADSFSSKNDIDGDGDMASTAWLIKGRDVSSATVTWTCTGVLREWDVKKTPEGMIEIDIFVRITSDTIPTAVT